jgi:hypothetical protein
MNLCVLMQGVNTNNGWKSVQIAQHLPVKKQILNVTPKIFIFLIYYTYDFHVIIRMNSVFINIINWLIL